MPMVMMSGWIAADTVDQDLRGTGTDSQQDRKSRAA